MRTKHLAIPLIASALVTLACRIYQISSPGASTTLEIVCFAVAFFTFVCTGVFNYLNKNVTSELHINKNMLVVALSLLLAPLIAADSVVRLVNYITVYRDIMQLLTGIFGILAGITVASIGLSFYKGENVFKTYKFATLFPSVWATFRLLGLFFVYNAVSNSPWEMPDEIAVIFSLLFLLNLARSFAHVENNKKIKNMFLWGIPAASFLLLHASKEFASYASGTKVFSVSSFILPLADTALALFIAAFLFVVDTQKTEEEIYLETHEPRNNEVAETEVAHVPAENVQSAVESTPLLSLTPDAN